MIVWLTLACSTPEAPPTPAVAPSGSPAPGTPAPHGEPVPDADSAPLLAGDLKPLAPIDGPRPDDCLLGPIQDLDLQLSPAQEGGATVTVVRDQRLVESFTLPDGIPVRVVTQGCSHIGIFTQFGLAAPPADPYAAALTLGARVKMASQDIVLDALERAGELDASGHVPCGDATCGVRVEGTTLTLEYDFAI